jgi:UDP-N-acetylmuramyl pentapeptide phosphotransferase/UDP-N-acetylglucosamine-1-phosphate transferase
MFDILLLMFLTFIIAFLNFVFKKNNFLLSFTGEKHQIFASKEKIPLSGGIIILISYFIFFTTYSKLLSIFIILIFAIGIISDVKVNFSPNIRLSLQFLIIILFLLLYDLKIENTRIIILDNLLKNQYLNYFFVSFCLLILINGSNLIDGLNTNVIGYYLIISILLLQTNFISDLAFSKMQWILWTISLSIVYIFNFLKKIFLGDNGSYILAFIYGIFLIEFYSNNNYVSPFFIIAILWYPCFELLFSISRKLLTKKSPFSADTRHLHQLLFSKILKSKIKITDKYKNSIAGTFLNIYNFFFIHFSFTEISNSSYQITLIIINTAIYSYSYFYLIKNN